MILILQDGFNRCGKHWRGKSLVLSYPIWISVIHCINLLSSLRTTLTSESIMNRAAYTTLHTLEYAKYCYCLMFWFPEPGKHLAWIVDRWLKDVLMNVLNKNVFHRPSTYSQPWKNGFCSENYLLQGRELLTVGWKKFYERFK